LKKDFRGAMEMKKVLVSLVIMGLMASASSQSAFAQTSGDVDFSVNNGGRALVTCTLDSAPSQRCTVTVHSQVITAGETSNVRKIATRKRGRKAVTKIRATRQPGVRQVDDVDPQIYMACKWVCGDTEIISTTAEGVTPNCGAGSATVRANTWLTLFRAKAKAAA